MKKIGIDISNQEDYTSVIKIDLKTNKIIKKYLKKKK